jgi:hypothetical protein
LLVEYSTDEVPREIVNTQFHSENLNGRHQLGDKSVDEKIILNWNLEKQALSVMIDWIHLAQDTCHCEHCNSSSGSIDCREFLNYLSDYQLLNKGFGSRS